MIKKNITVFILGIILSLMLTGCGVEEGTSVKKELIVDKSVPIESFDIEDYSKVLEAPSETYFEKIYNNIDDLYNEADNVVYGTVKSVEYFDETGVALTYFNFIIEKVYKGELNENDFNNDKWRLLSFEKLYKSFRKRQIFRLLSKGNRRYYNKVYGGRSTVDKSRR